MTDVIGIDFGTTSSVVVLAGADGRTRTARFGSGSDATETFRSVLCFWRDASADGKAMARAAGPTAIERYVDDPLDTRLIMSMKSYLAQRSFTDTHVYGHRFTLEALIAQFLRLLAQAAGIEPGTTRAVVGRPVRFVGEFADDALGEHRLRTAFADAGFSRLDVALEPEGAGYRFTRTLRDPATVLIADFGGGTSDFSVLRFEPSGEPRIRALGQAGVGIAGDTFDYRIIDHVISPLLGKGSTYSVMGSQALPVPADWYAGFARWHRLSLLRTPKMLRSIAEVTRTSSHPDRLARLVQMLEDEQGYHLYRAVSAAKAELSGADSARLRFSHANVTIDEVVTRRNFETWIAEDLARIDAAVGQALRSAGIGDGGVDRVFLTGGTSFVPAVRRLFERRFGPDTVAGGGEFISVAEGLALIGLDRGALPVGAVSAAK